MWPISDTLAYDTRRSAHAQASVLWPTGGRIPLLYSSRMNDAVSTATTVEPASFVRGCLRVPGDKSISHRYAILAALADGRSTFTGFATGADCAATLRCLQELGVSVTHTAEGQIVVDGLGLGGLQPSTAPLDTGNSGTTMRLMTGVLSAHAFETTLTGDDSLRRRPMRRIVDPLERMGARIETHNGCPPLTINGAALRGLLYEPEVASAQVKSAVLLAGLHATGTTTVRERAHTRDHTEQALPLFGVTTERTGTTVSVAGGQRLIACDATVPGDFSSAAFWFAAAAALPGSVVKVTGVGLNPTRSRLLDVLRTAGASVEVEPRETSKGEIAGTVRVSHHRLRTIEITAEEVPALIDELPALAALGVLGEGCYVSGAAELRAKESDRIAVLATGLRALGARVDESSDGFRVYGGTRLRGGTVDASGDHRMAMAFAIAALGATGPTVITGHEAVDISYPGFFETLATLRQ